MEDFDRITFRCGRCGNMGLISAVSINLTRIVLDGFCAHCRYTEKKAIDILEVDRWLRAPEHEMAQLVEHERGEEGRNAPAGIPKKGIRPELQSHRNQARAQEPRTGTSTW